MGEIGRPEGNTPLGGNLTLDMELPKDPRPNVSDQERLRPYTRKWKRRPRQPKPTPKD